jgi:hypothetical protein
LLQREDLFGEGLLEREEVAAVAVLNDEVEVFLVLLEVEEGDAVLLLHVAHAGHLAPEVLDQVVILPAHAFLLDQLQR